MTTGDGVKGGPALGVEPAAEPSPASGTERASFVVPTGYDEELFDRAPLPGMPSLEDPSLAAAVDALKDAEKKRLLTPIDPSASPGNDSTYVPPAPAARYARPENGSDVDDAKVEVRAPAPQPSPPTSHDHDPSRREPTVKTAAPKHQGARWALLAGAVALALILFAAFRCTSSDTPSVRASATSARPSALPVTPTAPVLASAPVSSPSTIPSAEPRTPAPTAAPSLTSTATPTPRAPAPTVAPQVVAPPIDTVAPTAPPPAPPPPAKTADPAAQKPPPPVPSADPGAPALPFHMPKPAEPKP